MAVPLPLASIQEERRSTHAQALTTSSPMTIGPVSLDDLLTLPKQPVFHWDVRDACAVMLLVFKYISKKLAENDVHVALIIVTHAPEILPVWPINNHARAILAKVVRKVCRKLTMTSKWVEALSSLCQPMDPGTAFEGHRTKSYLIHRSLVQHDVIFSGEGLTILAVDSVYTFKSLLTVLDKKDWVPTSRNCCKESCIQLLRHVNSTYIGIKLSRSYLKRAYQQIRLDDAILDEVCQGYQETYGKPGLAEMAQRKPSAAKVPASEATQRAQSITKTRASTNNIDLKTLRWPAAAAATIHESPKQAVNTKSMSPRKLPKLLTKDLDVTASNAIQEATRSPEDYYFSPPSRLHPVASYSAKPCERGRSIESMRMPQSARPRSRSRARHADPSPTVEESPLGIFGLPLTDLGSSKMPPPTREQSRSGRCGVRQHDPSPSREERSFEASGIPIVSMDAPPLTAFLSPKERDMTQTRILTFSEADETKGYDRKKKSPATPTRDPPNAFGQLETSVASRIRSRSASHSSLRSSQSTLIDTLVEGASIVAESPRFTSHVTRRLVGLPMSPDAALREPSPAPLRPRDLICSRCQGVVTAIGPMYTNPAPSGHTPKKCNTNPRTNPTPPSSAKDEMGTFQWQAVIRPSQPRDVDSVLFA
ncbi:hypothetical protein MMC13_006858 [Lambiella insularis]|nr:hypothetical protein [Lambiella insularis]